MRFPPHCRLRTPAQFAAVNRRGRRLQVGPLRVRWLANTCGHARLGMAIARKATRTAVTRNRVKRHLRETFRLHSAALPAIDISISLDTRSQKDFDLVEFNRSLEALWPQLIARASGSHAGSRSR